MAKTGGQAAAKRARELRKAERKEDKRERRETAAASRESLPEEEQVVLMEEFAELNRQLDGDLIGQAEFEVERRRIFVALGLEDGESADE
jgi:hypothetical protein